MMEDEEGESGAYEVIYIIDRDRSATTRAIRLTYVPMLLAAFVLTFLPHLKETMYHLKGAPDVTVRHAAAALMGWALALVAAAQSNYDAQRRVLQYSMVAELALVGGALAALGERKDNLNQIYGNIAMVLAVFGVSLHAVYFHQPEEDDDEDEEEDEE